MTVQEAHIRLDAWKPAYSPTAKKTGSSFVQEGDISKKKKDKDKNKVIPGDQHYGGGDTGNSRHENPCFRCDRIECSFWKCK